MSGNESPCSAARLSPAPRAPGQWQTARANSTSNLSSPQGHLGDHHTELDGVLTHQHQRRGGRAAAVVVSRRSPGWCTRRPGPGGATSDTHPERARQTRAFGCSCVVPWRPELTTSPGSTQSWRESDGGNNRLRRTTPEHPRGRSRHRIPGRTHRGQGRQAIPRRGSRRGATPAKVQSCPAGILQPCSRTSASRQPKQQRHRQHFVDRNLTSS